MHPLLPRKLTRKTLRDEGGRGAEGHLLDRVVYALKLAEVVFDVGVGFEGLVEDVHVAVVIIFNEELPFLLE